MNIDIETRVEPEKCRERNEFLDSLKRQRSRRIFSSTMLPQPMSAIRHVSCDGHTFFDHASESHGPVQTSAGAPGHIAGRNSV
jgi:hypothetical protein